MPLGITVPIKPGVGKEKDRARYLHAKVWGSTNYARYDELKDVADELLQKEVRNGYVQWCANRAELEQEVGALHLAKIAVVVKLKLAPKNNVWTKIWVPQLLGRSHGMLAKVKWLKTPRNDQSRIGQSRTPSRDCCVLATSSTKKIRAPIQTKNGNS